MSTFATTISKTKNSLSILLITTSIVLFVGYKSYTASQQSLTLTRELAGLLRNKQYVVAGKFIREHLDDGLKKSDLLSLEDSLLQKSITCASIVEGYAEIDFRSFIQAVLFTEILFPKYIENKCYYLSPKETGLAYALEYDPETQYSFIHLDNLIGIGHEKIVTKSILYGPTVEVVARAKQKDNLDNEIEITKLLRGYPGIFDVKACTRHIEDNIPYTTLFSRLYHSGSLQDVFDKTTSFSLSEKMHMAFKILQGIAVMHEKQIVHRDLGARNYFVTIPQGTYGKRDIDIAIADLGRANYVTKVARSKAQGNVSYAPPEAIFRDQMKGCDYFASDLFAIGCVFYQLFYEKKAEWQKIYYLRDTRNKEVVYKEYVDHLLRCTNPRRQELANIRMQRLLSPAEEFEELILQMVDVEPKNRTTAADLKEKLKDIITRV